MSLDLTCRTTETNNPDLSGVTSFHGALGPTGSCEADSRIRARPEAAARQR